jgi:malonyl-CoA/methylmalonyl-CoA synthetase
MFLDTLADNYKSHPDKIAIEFIIDDGTSQTLTYHQLGETVNRTAHYLKSLGVQTGDRVAVQLPKCLPFIYIHLAAVRIGAIFLPLNPAYPLTELIYFLDDSEASILIADQATQSNINTILPKLPAIQHCRFIDPSLGSWESIVADFSAEPPTTLPTDRDQTAVMLYTSGTTSRPKGAEITHGNLTANIEALHTAWGWQFDDVILHVLPIFHVHGLIVAFHGALHAGATAVILPKFDAQQAIELLPTKRFTVFMAVPTIHRRLYNAAKGQKIDLSHMRLMTSGSDRLPDDLFSGYQQTFNYTLLERYGMTETGMNLSNPYDGERRVGSVGMPLPGVEARIVNPENDSPLPDGEVGEVQIKGAHVCKGYWRQPDKTASAFTDEGWLRTGDMGVRASDGYFTLKGRAKDLIITGGLNVYPPEVELVLMEHPSVSACAVIGCPDEEWGEQITAVIITADDATIEPAALIALCREHLASYKVPRLIVFAEAFPRNALGKIQKAKLRESLC